MFGEDEDVFDTTSSFPRQLIPTAVISCIFFISVIGNSIEKGRKLRIIPEWKLPRFPYFLLTENDFF